MSGFSGTARAPGIARRALGCVDGLPGAARALPAAVFAVALAARLVAPAPFVTWDEPTWTYRALQFTRAMERGDYAATWQSPHPGVVTLWAASAGITARRLWIDAGAGTGAGPGDSSSPAVSDPVGDSGAGGASDPASASGTPGDLAFVDELPNFDEDDVELLRRILPWHPAARAAIGWLTAALVALAAWMLVPLVGRGTAWVAGLMMALDPYLLAHSRVLHLDAVMALLVACSAIAVVRAYHATRPGEGRMGPAGSEGESGRPTRGATGDGGEGRGWGARVREAALERAAWRWVAVSGAFGGLAALAKSPGVFAAAFALAVIVVGTRRGGPLAAVRGLAVWGGGAALLYLAAWPALWAEPLGTVQRMAGYAADAAGGGGAREAVYFMGTVRPDPGALFYAVAIPHRLTPLAVVGVAASVVAAVRRRPPAVLWMLVLVVSFTVLMGRSAKKFERYDLPVFPALQVVAATGLVAAGAGVGRAWQRRSGTRLDSTASAAAGQARQIAVVATAGQDRLIAVVAAALVLVQAGFTLRHLPYGLAYSNPLLGGGPAAAERLPVGWGEGADLVVEWLNDRPGASESSIATPSMTLVGPGFVGRTLRARDWASADRVVLYVDDVQIREPREIVEAFHGVRMPEHVVRLNGIDYAWIYAVPPEGR